MAASLSAETRRLSAEMKIPSAEVEKSRASALSGGATKRGSPGPIGRGYLFEVHRSKAQKSSSCNRCSKMPLQNNIDGPETDSIEGGLENQYVRWVECSNDDTRLTLS